MSSQFVLYINKLGLTNTTEVLQKAQHCPLSSEHLLSIYYIQIQIFFKSLSMLNAT